MLKHIPVKKEYLLIIASILMFFISYQFAFKKTINAWQVNKSLKNKIERAGDLSVQPAYLERKNINLGKIIDRYKSDTSEFRNSTIANIAILAEKENVKLSEVPLQDPVYHSDKFIIQTLSFEGDYYSLTKVVHRLQSAEKVGFLRSVNFKRVKELSSVAERQKIVLDCFFVVEK